MATRSLNRPNGWQKQVNPNTKRMKALMRDVKGNVVRLTRNSKDLDTWMEKLAPYTASNCFVTGAHAEAVREIVNQIAGVVNQTSLPSGANAEIVKGTMAEACMTMVSNVGEDIKSELQRIAVESYNARNTPQQTAQLIGEKIDSLSKTRCEAIARTETCRAANIANYLNAKEMGAKSYSVICNEGCCEYCQEAYGTDESGGVGDIVFDIEDTEDLPPYHPNCYMPDTKVYTNNGWKYFHDITETDKILSLNPETNETAFLDYVKVIKTTNVHGLMYHIHNKWFDVCITPDHDCFIHQRRDGGKRGKYHEPQFRKPTELTIESKFLRCIDYDKQGIETINVNGLEFKASDYAFFMAWYLSEGSILHDPESAKKRGYPIKITQEINDNREIIQPIFERISEYLGIKLYVGKSYFEFHSKELHDYLEPLGYSHEKYIPSEVFDLSKDDLNIFLDNYVLGDGHERKPNKYHSTERSLFTSSPRLRDDLSYLILLCGFYPSIYIHSRKGTVTHHKNGEYVQKNDVYRIGINTSKYTQFGSCIVDEIVYDGDVFCVELPEWHTLWVMRDGKTSWNGNCRCTPVWSMDPVESVEDEPTEEPVEDKPIEF